MVYIIFFQAEDGIRDYKVTGVQTCALPILDAQVILLRGTPPSVQALVAGSVYVGGATPDAVMDVSERGIDLVMVVGLINGLSHAIMGGKNYKRYEDLRGATIGGQSLTSGITFPLKPVLKSKGLENPRHHKLVHDAGTP